MKDCGLFEVYLDLDWFFWLLMVCIVVVFGVSLAYVELTTDYVMPNGVKCEEKYSGWISNSRTFDLCSDGKKYINPESYLEVKK